MNYSFVTSTFVNMITLIERRGNFELIELLNDSSEAIIDEVTKIWYHALQSDNSWHTLVKDLSPTDSLALDRKLCVEPYVRRTDTRVFAVRELATKYV